MKLRHTLLLAGLLVSRVAWADAWTVSPGFEGTPAATDPVSQGDDEIRLMRVETRQRLNVEHHFGTVTDADDNGTHRLGSARCFIQSAAPTTTEVADYNNTGGASTSTLSATATNSAPAETLGLGRCWYDTDNGLYYIYTASGWALAGGSGDIAKVGATNLAYNGSFEVNTAGATSVPDGWALSATPTLAYSTVAVSEGTGRALSVTADAANEGVSLTLAGLKALTSYRVVARANASTAADTCDLRTTGGGTNITDTTATTAAYETLEGTFITDGTPANVVIILEANANTDVCLFDEVGIYEISTDGMPTAGSVPIFGCTNATTNLTNNFNTGPNPILTQAVTVPGPGYYIRVVANAAVVQTSASDSQLDARIRENASTVVAQASQQGSIDTAAIGVALNYIKTNPTPGTTYSYTLEIAENASIPLSALAMANAAGGADLSKSCMSVELVPVR